MRLSWIDDGQIRALLKTELARFKELDEKKKALYRKGDDIQAYEEVNAQWKDSAEEINHLHRKLYPFFPRSGSCPNCGCDTLPTLGPNHIAVYQCIACEEQLSRW